MQRRALKIDKSFTAQIREPDDEGAVIRAVVGLGHALAMKVTAEGIDTQAQLDYVRAVGVDHGQGYLLAKPLSPPDAAALLSGGPLTLAAVPTLAA